MDPDTEDEEDVFSDPGDPAEEEEEEQEVDEEEDARIFNARKLRNEGGGNKPSEEEEEKQEVKTLERKPESSLETTVRPISGRRASLPCQVTLSSMKLSRLHAFTKAPVTARVLLCRSSSRRLIEAPPIITEAPPPSERRFRRRNVMSLSDADSVCLLCQNDLSKGAGGTRELPCNHSFHRECIEEHLWRKQSCPTCRVQVSVPCRSTGTPPGSKCPDSTGRNRCTIKRTLSPQ